MPLYGRQMSLLVFSKKTHGQPLMGANNTVINGNDNINQQNSCFTSKYNGPRQETNIYSGPENRNGHDRRENQSRQCEVDFHVLGVNFAAAARHHIVMIIMTSVLLALQLVVFTIIFFILARQHDAQAVIIGEVKNMIENQQMKQEFAIERLLTDFEIRQKDYVEIQVKDSLNRATDNWTRLTKDITEEMKQMKIDLMESNNQKKIKREN